MSAAFTPRVRVLAVCDEAVASEIEADVFTLEGVRYGFGSESFPCVRSLNAYLMMSYPRGGSFKGHVSLVPAGQADPVESSAFTADFGTDSHALALAVELGECIFPEPEAYTIEVRFSTKSGAVLRAEQPFHVWQLEG